MQGRIERGFTLLELIIVIALVAIVAAIAIPNLLTARKSANEVAAIGALKSITEAQSLFREGDKDSDFLYDYGTLAQLSSTNMIDQVLGGGTKQGYHFQTGAPPTTSEFLFFSIANPASFGDSGDRSFCSNHMGALYYTTSTSGFAMNNTDCAVPAGAIPLK